MANYTAKARTNFFRVKDVTALKAELANYGLLPNSSAQSVYGSDFVLDEDPTNKPEGAIAFIIDGTWPSFDEDSVASRLDAEDDEEIPTKYDDIVSLVADHLIDGDVAVFMEVGSEKMRYFGGISVAVNSKGETRRVDLDDIYGVAKELAIDDRAITVAAY